MTEDRIAVVMRTHGLDFVEAVHFVARERGYQGRQKVEAERLWREPRNGAEIILFPNWRVKDGWERDAEYIDD